MGMDRPIKLVEYNSKLAHRIHCERMHMKAHESKNLCQESMLESVDGVCRVC